MLTTDTESKQTVSKEKGRVQLHAIT